MGSQEMRLLLNGLHEELLLEMKLWAKLRSSELLSCFRLVWLIARVYVLWVVLGAVKRGVVLFLLFFVDVLGHS